MSENVVLNADQSAAVTAGDGPILVLAGAGTGKTRVIVERVVWLVRERGIDPRNILALTFTNRAANEMKQRVAARLEVDRLASWVGTFHSFSLFVLRREGERLGLPSQFTVFDDTDQLSLMRRLIRELPEEYEKVTPRQALHWISRLKQDLREPESDIPPATAEEETCRYLWAKYHGNLRAGGAVDFDDLLVMLARLLEEFPDVADKYQRRYRHVLVDEYQDTNHAQYRIVTRLTQAARNVFVVGDEDQSIYSWRGANLDNILNFQKEFDNAQVFRLERNYRSTAPILEAANAVVSNNQQRLGKNLYTREIAGEGVRFYLAQSAEDEARFLVDDMQTIGKDMKTTGILYRTNGQARLVEEALLRQGIRYTVVGSVRFYSRKEIKDLLSYLRLLVNPADDEALRRIINVPPRGIGETTLHRLAEYAALRSTGIFPVLREIEHDQTIQPRTRTAIAGFVQLIDDLALESKKSGLAALVESLLEKTRYLDYLRASDEKDFRDRQEVVAEFLSACASFDAKKAGGVAEFLQELALMSDQDELDLHKAPPAVTLLTCHSAKGLEFDAVYLIGLEEGLLPHANAIDSKREMEEERRLCYVAMTRARKRLTLTAAQSRMLQGHDERRAASRFIKEIPPGKLDFLMGGKTAPAKGRPAGVAVSADAGAPPAGDAIKTGTKVRHPRFGKGHVLYTQGSGATMKIRIRFDTGRVGTFLLQATPLEIEGKR